MADNIHTTEPAAALPKYGPFIASSDNIEKSMWGVSAALLPAVIGAVIFFGPYALYLILATALASTLFEYPFARHTFSLKKPFGDGSAFLGGLLLGLTLAPGTPWWMPFMGAGLLVIIGKHFFGGLGNNIFNPALLARAILLLAWPAMITQWHVPFQYDVITAATPLQGASASYLELFFGNVPGSIGETSVLALLIGYLFLHLKKLSNMRISISFLASAFIAALMFGIDPLFTLLSGGLMFTALFMAADMVTSPTGKAARVVFGIGCGFLTVFLREFTIFPEGATFAVLFMNGLVPVIDSTVTDSFFGQVEKRKLRIAAGSSIAAGAVILISLGLIVPAIRNYFDSYYVSGTVRQDLDWFFPDARYANPYETAFDDIYAEQVFSRDGAEGYLVYSSAQGYGGRVSLVTALNNDNYIIGMRVLDQNESPTLGTLIRRPSFLNQFLRRSTSNPAVVQEQLIPITGATVSSRAVAEAVERALRFKEEPAAPRAAALDLSNEGTFTGSGFGYQGEIEVEVTVSGNRIQGIDVLRHSETSRIGEPALSTLIDSVISRQDVNIDTVSGATGTSRGFINALEQALGGP